MFKYLTELCKVVCLRTGLSRGALMTFPRGLKPQTHRTQLWYDVVGQLERSSDFASNFED